MSAAVACVLCLAAVSVTACRSGKQETFIDGREVEKVEQKWGAVFPFPFTKGVSQVYYGYHDASGKFVLHGPKRLFNQDGKLTYEAFYRDGKLVGTSTYWNDSGTAKEVEEFWKDGVKVGSAQYSKSGELGFYNEDIYAGSRRVAHKSYSYKTRQWTLCSYEPNDLAIGPDTGKLMHSSGAMTKKCEGP